MKYWSTTKTIYGAGNDKDDDNDDDDDEGDDGDE